MAENRCCVGEINNTGAYLCCVQAVVFDVEISSLLMMNE
jgi:hypothetical protein